MPVRVTLISWPLAIVDAVLLMLAISNMKRRMLAGTLFASMMLLLAACGSDPVEQAQVVSVPPTSVPTTAPLFVPTPTTPPVPTATPAAVPQATPTPLPAPLPAATAAPLPTATVAPAAAAAPTVAAAPSPTAAPAVAPTAAATAEPPTPVPTAAEPESVSTPVPTPVPETPTPVVVASGEPPLECYDRVVKVYRAFVEGVDELSFEGGRVFCSGAGTNAVSAAGSYRHSSGLVVQRNADFIFNDAGTAYIPYSGTIHFCTGGQPASAPVRADTVPSLLVVIDSEAQRLVAQGATGPAGFNGSSQC